MASVVDVAGEYLYGQRDAQPLHDFRKQDGNGIGFLSAGAPRHPHPDAVSGLPGSNQWHQRLLLEGLESLAVSEKTGHADEHVLDQAAGFCRVFGHQLDVVRKNAELVDRPCGGQFGG
jgi:hypothetical protein